MASRNSELDASEENPHSVQAQGLNRTPQDRDNQRQARDGPTNGSDSADHGAYSQGDVDEGSEDGTGERPVRQQLKKTSIGEPTPADALTAEAEDDSMASSEESPAGKLSQASETSSIEGRGRVRKRSIDDLDSDEESAEGDDPAHPHRRKRSRELRRSPFDRKNVEDGLGKIRSPRKKRSRDQLDTDDPKAVDPISAAPKAEGEPEKKRARDNSQERSVASEESTKATLANPFSNTSSTSPFASISHSKQGDDSQKDEAQKEHPVTSSSAFAASTLAAFAGSEKSPFGTIGTGESVFKSAASPPGGTRTECPEGSAFANSAFGAAAATPSAFGSLGGGFSGSGFAGFGTPSLKPGGGLTSFAAPGGPGILGSGSKPKVLGASSDNEGEDEEDDGEEEHEGSEKAKDDEKFVFHTTETGEEAEETYFSCRSKLFYFTGKEWKERGVGTFKINVSLSSTESEEPSAGGESGKPLAKKHARMIMRADGVLRVILNSPLFKGMKVGSPSGDEPIGKQVNLVGVEDGKTVPLLLKTSSNEVAKDLYKTAQDLISEL